MIGTVEGRGQPDGAAADGEEEDESLSIINESDFSPLTRSFISQLTTPRATPLLSPETPSPRSSWSAGPQIFWRCFVCYYGYIKCKHTPVFKYHGLHEIL